MYLKMLIQIILYSYLQSQQSAPALNCPLKWSTELTPEPSHCVHTLEPADMPIKVHIRYNNRKVIKLCGRRRWTMSLWNTASGHTLTQEMDDIYITRSRNRNLKILLQYSHLISIFPLFYQEYFNQELLCHKLTIEAQ